MSRVDPPNRKIALTEIEAALRSLAPASGAIDRDAVMFRAGRRSARRGWVWPSASAALALVVLGETAYFTTRPAPEPRIIERERIVEVPKAEYSAPVVILRRNPAAAVDSVPVVPTDLGGDSGWLAIQDNYRLREQALRFGVDGLPDPPPSASRADPARDRELFRTEIQSFLDPGGTL